MLGEAIYYLSLVFRGMEGVRVETNSVLRTTGVAEVGLIESCSGAAPASVKERLVEF